MKKKILLIVGIACVIVGIVLTIVFDKKEEKKHYDIIVDVTEKTGDKIDNKAYSYYKWKKLVTTSIKDRNLETKNKYIFSYPDELKEYFLDQYNKLLTSDNIKLEVYDVNTFSKDEYIAEISDNYNQSNFNKINYSSNNIKISDYNAGYIKFEAIKEKEVLTSTGKAVYEEKYVIFIEDSTKTIIIAYTLENQKFSEEFLLEVTNLIKVEKGSSIYLSSKIENNKLTGTIKQNKHNNYQNGYNISYSIDSQKYEEFEINTNNYNVVNFKSKNNENLLITLKTLTSSIDDDVLKFTSEMVKNKYKNTELYTLKTFKEEQKVYNGKNYYQISLVYNDKNLEQDKYIVQLLEQVEKNYAVSLTLESLSKIEETEIFDFLNYEVKEY